MEEGVGNSPETGGSALEFPVFDGVKLSSPLTVPLRLRRRLTKSKATTSPSTVEEIEAKLRNADLRRQKYYENLSSKAWPKHRSPQAADEHNLAQRLDAKLKAAEQKRMQILKVHSQQRATLSEKTSQSLLRTIALQSKYKEHVNNAAICHKKVHGELLPQIERQKLSESLEDKLQRVNRQKTDYLMQKVSLHNTVGVNWNKKMQKQAGHLSRILLRCWRNFLTQGTTLNLVKSYHILDINTSHVKSMPFDEFALLIETPSTLQITKAFLNRLETHYRVLLDVTSGTNFHGQDDINHLLTRVVSSYKTATKTHAKLSRYQPRVVLSAYMILGYPDAVFSGQGVRETALAKSSMKFIQEFECLIDIINGPSNTSVEESKWCTFRFQLAAFDAAWCSYLNSFVVWKVKDVESLEKDLVRAACQMEISMIKKYKPTLKGDDSALTHDVKAFQKQMQVTEHQKLLREKILHLSGKAGIKRLQNALSDTRKKYFKSKENCSSVESPVAHLASSCSQASTSVVGPDETNNSVVGEKLGKENVFIVNEFLHGRRYAFADSLNITDENQKVRETMEKAFWDGIFESIQQQNYDHVVVLMKEVRDELCEMSPKSQEQEIIEAIDLDILSQLLSSDHLDIEYLGKIMEFALVSLQKLSAISCENQLTECYQTVISDLAQLCEAGGGSKRSHAIALIKGLQFVLKQIQKLKKEINKARFKILEPLLRGPTGLEYLNKAFTKLYGQPSDALTGLPLTMQWLSSVVPDKDQEWSEHKMSLLELQEGSCSGSERPVLPSTTLRTGGRLSSRLQTSTSMSLPDISGAKNRSTEYKGEKGDLLVRLGLLKLVNNVNGVTQEELPETLKLNFQRLRSVQNQLQKITVIATSILVLRQTLVMEQMISNHDDMENTIFTCFTQLSQILETAIDPGLEEIVKVLSKIVEGFDTTKDSTKTHSRRLVMANMLKKSVQSGDPVFVRVSRAVYLATRGVVLGGKGNHGRELAEKALRQVGATVLTDKVVKLAGVLGVMARVSENVHGPWYARLIENM